MLSPKEKQILGLRWLHCVVTLTFKCVSEGRRHCNCPVLLEKARYFFVPIMVRDVSVSIHAPWKRSNVLTDVEERGPQLCGVVLCMKRSA